MDYYLGFYLFNIFRNDIQFVLKMTKIQNIIKVPYSITSTILASVPMSDLGIILHNEGNFNIHYDYVINHSLKVLGFICSINQDFSE